MVVNLWQAFLDQLDKAEQVRWDTDPLDGLFIQRNKEGASREDERGKATKLIVLA